MDFEERLAHELSRRMRQNSLGAKRASSAAAMRSSQ
jgi:hypothetical protein